MTPRSRNVLLTATIVPALSALVLAGPEETSSRRTISVSGTAMGYAPPDIVQWSLDLESNGKGLLETKAASDQQVMRILEVCKAYAITNEDIDIGVLRVGDVKPGDPAKAADPQLYFKATRTMTVRQRNLHHFGDLLRAFAPAKGMGFRYCFVSSKIDQLTRETLVKATRVAKEKAQAMAAVADARLGQVVRIDEHLPEGKQVPAEQVPVDITSAAFGADSIALTATVFAVFELQ